METLGEILEFVDTFNVGYGDYLNALIENMESHPTIQRRKVSVLRLENEEDLFLLRRTTGEWFRVEEDPLAYLIESTNTLYTNAIYVENSGEYVILVGEFSPGDTQKGSLLSSKEVPPL